MFSYIVEWVTVHKLVWLKKVSDLSKNCKVSANLLFGVKEERSIFYLSDLQASHTCFLLAKIFSWIDFQALYILQDRHWMLQFKKASDKHRFVCMVRGCAFQKKLCTNCKCNHLHGKSRSHHGPKLFQSNGIQRRHSLTAIHTFLDPLPKASGRRR